MPVAAIIEVGWSPIFVCDVASSCEGPLIRPSFIPPGGPAFGPVAGAMFLLLVEHRPASVPECLIGKKLYCGTLGFRVSSAKPLGSAALPRYGESMAKNRNTFEKSQREHAKRRKAEEKRASRQRRKDEPDSAISEQRLEERDRARGD